MTNLKSGAQEKFEMLLSFCCTINLQLESGVCVGNIQSDTQRFQVSWKDPNTSKRSSSRPRRSKPAADDFISIWLATVYNSYYYNKIECYIKREVLF